MHGRAATQRVARHVFASLEDFATLEDFRANPMIQLKPFARLPLGGFERRVFA